MAINSKAPAGRPQAAASPDAGCRVGPLGNLVMTGFVAIALAMAVVAIHQEERMAHHEQQLLDQQR